MAAPEQEQPGVEALKIEVDAAALPNGAAEAATEGSPPPKVEKSLHDQAMEHLHQTACTVYHSETDTYEYPKVLRTSHRDLGVITQSVGVQLYFMFIKRMGVVFLIMFILSLPMLIFNCMGGMVDTTNATSKALARASVANIGVCPAIGCRSLDELKARCLFKNCEEKDKANIQSWRVRDVSQWLGLLDGIGILVFMAFGVWFRHITIPATVKQVDKATVTPADYSVQLTICPRFLGDGVKSDHHKTYEEKLKQHFLNVLERVHEHDQDAVANVCLVREYDGAIAIFMEKGRHLQEIANNEKLLEKWSAERPTKVPACEKWIKNGHKALEKLEKSLAAQAEMVDEERAVCLAFVTFSKEVYKAKVLKAYGFARYMIFRPCQSHHLKFEGHKICVEQACEPNDLFWENLDFNPYKRIARKVTTFILTVLVLIICSLLLVTAQSRPQKVVNNVYPTWAIKNEDVGTGSCLQICQWTLYDGSTCAGGSSANWSSASIFDFQKKVGTTMGTSYFKGNTTVCRPLWESPGCNLPAANSSTEDWIAITFTTPQEVKCMRLVQSISRPAKEVRIFGCQDSPETASVPWNPLDSCKKMQVVKPASIKLAKNTGIASGSLKVIKDVRCETATANRDAFISLTVATQAKELGDDETVDCYCQQQAAQDASILTPPYDTPEQKVCKEWAIAEALTWGKLIGGMIAVVVLNQILLAVFAYFIDVERPPSVTEHTRSTLFKLFLSQFVNTALLIYLVNVRITNIPGVIQIITEPLRIGKGPYYEADTAWFTGVGSSLIITIIGQVFSTTIPPVIMAKFVAPLLRWYAVRSGTKATKEALFDVYTLPSWDLALRLAQSMNVICVIIMYAGGMPVLYLIGILYCIVAYWLDKYALLRASKRPPGYTENVVEVCMHLLPLAAFLHTLFACSVLGNTSVLPSDWSYLLKFAEGIFGISLKEYGRTMDAWYAASTTQREEMYQQYLTARFLDFAREGAWLLMLIFLLGCAYYIIYYAYSWLLAPFLNPFLFMAEECFWGKAKMHSEHIPPFHEAQEDMKQRGTPSTYQMEENESYAAAHQALMHTTQRVLDAEKAELPDVLTEEVVKSQV